MNCKTEYLVFTILIISTYGKSNNHLYVLQMAEKYSTQALLTVPSTSLTACILFCQLHGMASLFDKNTCFCVAEQQSQNVERPVLLDNKQLFAKKIEYYGPCTHKCQTGACLNWNNAKGYICRDKDGFELQQEFVCFQPLNDKYGEFEIQRNGVVTDMKLVHANGTLTCWKNVLGETYFGCLGNKNDMWSKELIGVVISDTNKNKLLPIQPLNGYGYYNLPGNLPSSSVINFVGYNLAVNEGYKMRLWFGEDFLNVAEADNFGHVCAHIYVKYAVA